MEPPITITTHFTEYESEYSGSYSDYFQIHIYSVPEIISTYYDPERATVESVRNAATQLLKAIRERSSRKDRISLFEKDGKFLRNPYGYPESPKFPGYDNNFKKAIIEDTGDRFVVPD